MTSSAMPADQSLAAALKGSEPLAGLMQRLRASRARLEAVAPLLPPALRAGVRAGPLDDTSWILLVDNAASAAKLRQLLPTLQQTLAAAGWSGPAIKIKVRPRD